MQAKHQRNISGGKEYDYLFPKANGEEITIKWNANVQDTLDFIPKLVLETLSDTQALAKLLKGATTYETCHHIWDFVYNHIQYHYDKEGTEQVRRPARTWMDRVRGVDCDCYTVFISSILTNLNIPHSYRITKYKNKDYYQHIYPIVPTENGKYLTLDCVVKNFNYEEPFTQKKDTSMKLTYLNGIEDTETPNTLMAIMPISDISHLPDFEDFDGVGKVKVGEKIKDIAHVANRANPATTLLRAGILASMKLNLFKVGSNLRYAYLTDEQAQAQNMDLDKIKKLRQILKKMEDIFYGAGGKPENLKKAILTGNGNKDHEVKGIPMKELVDDFNGIEDELDINTPLKELLSSIYTEEYADAVNEVSGLGDPATGTAVAAATTVIGTIAAIIKSVGIPKLGGAKTIASTTTVANADGTTTTDTTTTTPAVSDAGAVKPTFSENAKAFYTEHKTVIIVGGVVLVSAVALGAWYHHHKKHPKHPAQNTQAVLSGAPSRKKKRGKKHKKAPIALL